ncbi:MAG: tRNA pseudouridine(13) synthase TruD [Planctomycetes bacterium]|nr:tRNA pseudouridine(13) synthase TruD [Planctomycetota bacterium]
MKIKRKPEDFQVEELSGFAPAGGAFALYRLTKRSLGTPEAIQAIARRWEVPRRRISFGGLKDRHALTRQFVTIERGPRRDLRQTHLELTYLGQAARPFVPKDIAGNRFTVVLRDVAQPALDRALGALNEVARDRCPNYFDDQRFGSLGAGGEFVAHAWCEGRYERALWLALAEPNEHDRPAEREQKRMLLERWGDWAACKESLARSHRRSIITYLSDHPTDFRGAFARVQRDLRGLYLAAFQSFLWNRLLAACLRESCRPDQLSSVRLKSGTLPFYRSLDPSQRTELGRLEIPLPSARERLEDACMKIRVERVLGEFGLEWSALRIRHPKDSYFSRGRRPATFAPAALTHEASSDELYPSRRKLALRFELPRGAYATILIKRLTEL